MGNQPTKWLGNRVVTNDISGEPVALYLLSSVLYICDAHCSLFGMPQPSIYLTMRPNLCIGVLTSKSPDLQNLDISALSDCFSSNIPLSFSQLQSIYYTLPYSRYYSTWTSHIPIHPFLHSMVTLPSSSILESKFKGSRWHQYNLVPAS